MPPQQPIISQYPIGITADKKAKIKKAAVIVGIVVIITIIIIIAVVSLSIFSILDGQNDDNVSGGYFYRHYSWYYGGYEWTWDMWFPKQTYYEYESRSHSLYLSEYVTEYDSYVILLAEKLADAAELEGYNHYETVSFVLSFVQSLRYTSDIVTTGYNEYPKYPVETLIDQGGDCEDTSILFAALLESHPLNYDAVLLEIPADNPYHVAVGVWGEEEIDGSLYVFQNRDYYYCETTGSGWEIGEKPPEFNGESALVIQV